MKRLITKSLILSIVTVSLSQWCWGDSCNDPSRQQSVCREMKHLRSQLLVLGAERDLMQINYDLLAQVGAEIQSSSSRALKDLKTTDENHSIGLIGVQAIALDLVEQSKNKNGDAFITANKIQQQCASCHSTEAPTSGHKWDDIFKSDWSVFYKKCNMADRNPYRCKSMHGMFSYYSGFYTAYQLGIQNYELTGMQAKRIESIATTLKENGLVHGLEDMMGQVITDAQEIQALALQKNPETFGRAMAITQSCMKCHADRNVNAIRASFNLKAFSPSK